MIERNAEDYLETEPSANDKKPLVDWENAPTVADMKADYIEAQSDTSDHVTKVSNWLDNLNITGNAKVKKVKGRSSRVPRLIRKQAEWRYAALTEPFLSTDDIFNADPVTFEDKEGAYQNALVLNNQFNTKLNKVNFIDEYVRTIVNEGTVIVRVGWQFLEEEVEVEVPQFEFEQSDDPAVMEQHEVFHQLMQEDPERFEREAPEEWQQAHQLSMENNVPISPIQTGTVMEKQLQTVKNQPELEVMDYRRISIDPTCKGELDKANFVIYSFDTSLSELEKDGRYSNLDAVGITNHSVLSDPDSMNGETPSFNFKDEPRKKFVAYEYWGYWDIHGTGIAEPFVATYVGDTLIRMEDNPFPDKGLPFVAAQYLPVKKSVFGEPDGELLEENQKISGAVMRGMIDTLGRSANAQQGTRVDALDVTNKRKFDAGQDYEYNSNVDPRQAFHMHTYPELPQSGEYMLQLQNSDAESLTGVKAFSSGITGQALGSTATGIRSALDATSKRELGILRRLADGIKQIGRKIMSMNAEFLSEDEVVRVTNENFVAIRKDDLRGDYDISLSISTAEADNQKAEELSFMLQTTAQSMGPEYTTFILSEIAKLRKMPALAKKIEEYQPTPDPIAQEKAQLELELLRAQIAETHSKTVENQAEARLDMAKANTEGAKASNLGSDTDLKNLDFVEQESGTKQERELQKQGEQARAQAGMKVMDHKLKQAETRSSSSADDVTTTNGISSI